MTAFVSSFDGVKTKQKNGTRHITGNQIRLKVHDNGLKWHSRSDFVHVKTDKQQAGLFLYVCGWVY